MTMRLGTSSEPIRAGVRRTFISRYMTAACSLSPALLHGDLAAVEIDGRPMQPARARGDHEGDEIRYVLDRAVARDAGLAAELGADFCLGLSRPLDLGADAPPLPLGLDQRRMDAVDPYAVLFTEVGEALGEGGDGGVDRAADGESFLRFSSAGTADRDQRAAALLQERPGRALGRAGIVDQNVEPAEFASYRLDQRLGRVRLAQIEHPHRDLASFVADRLRNAVERMRVAAGEHEIAARFGESEGNATADAAARSGHERDLPRQPKLHSATPLKTWMAL